MHEDGARETRGGFPVAQKEVPAGALAGCHVWRKTGLSERQQDSVHG